MSSKKLLSKKVVRSAYLDALLDPLGSMKNWTTMATARNELELLASSALVQRNHSLWWNYIYLHERYIQQFSPAKKNILPGFPDMDTALKVGAPFVYNWYYVHHSIPTTPWQDVDFSDLSLGVRSNSLPVDDACEMLRLSMLTWNSGSAPDAHSMRSVPFWLLADAWKSTPVWGSLLRALTAPLSLIQPAGISLLDRTVVDPSAVWQWECLNNGDISFLPQEAAYKALDGLRFSNIGDTLRSNCESHFLTYLPQCHSIASIAFSLGGPLWVPVMDTLAGETPAEIFEFTFEALHEK